MKVMTDDFPAILVDNKGLKNQIGDLENKIRLRNVRSVGGFLKV